MCKLLTKVPGLKKQMSAYNMHIAHHQKLLSNCTKISLKTPMLHAIPVTPTVDNSKVSNTISHPNILLGLRVRLDSNLGWVAHVLTRKMGTHESTALQNPYPRWGTIWAKTVGR